MKIGKIYEIELTFYMIGIIEAVYQPGFWYKSEPEKPIFRLHCPKPGVLKLFKRSNTFWKKAKYPDVFCRKITPFWKNHKNSKYPRNFKSTRNGTYNTLWEPIGFSKALYPNLEQVWNVKNISDFNFLIISVLTSDSIEGTNFLHYILNRYTGTPKRPN